MRFRDDNRAVTVQIGAVMLFATIVIALSLYQATVVPSQNADVEYKHSQVVQGQLVDVRNALLSTAASGSTRPASVELGTGYPSRVFLMNPPPATGTLRTGAYANSTIRVSNINATNNETADFLNGSWSASTKYLLYQPHYHEFDGAPALLYEASVLSNHYPDANATIPLTDQLLVRGNTITLVTLNGTLSTTRAGSVSVSPNPLSAPYQRVQVEPAGGGSGPITVSVPTRIPADRLASRTRLGENPNVTVSQAGTNRVRIEVSGYSAYTLQTARIGVGSNTVDPPAHYLTVVESDDDSVTVEARDRFNNAESGVKVTASNPSLFEPNSTRTGVNGRATFTVTSSGNWSSSLFILDNSTAREYVTASGTTGGGPSSPPGTTNDRPTVEITDIQVDREGDSGVHSATVTFTPDDQNDNLDSATIVLYVGGTEENRLRGIDISGEEGNSVTESISKSGKAASGTVEVKVIVYDTDDASGSDRESENDPQP